MFKFKRLLISFIAVLAVCGIEARADPLVLNNISGHLTVYTSMDGGPPTLRLPPEFLLSGPGLTVIKDHIAGNGGGDVGNVETRDVCLGMICTEGNVLGTDSSFSGTLASGSGTVAFINGVRYQDLVVISGSLYFVSPDIVLPEYELGIHDVTVPFAFSGEVHGTAAQYGQDPVVFSAIMSGHGFATFSFLNMNYMDPSSPIYKLDSIEYRFEPVPEPATLLLMSTGLTGFAMAARRRWRR